MQLLTNMRQLMLAATSASTMVHDQTSHNDATATAVQSNRLGAALAC